MRRVRRDLRGVRYRPGLQREWPVRLQRELVPERVLLGRDLQFIRINGTVVGAGVGLALHALAVALAHTFFHLPYHWAEMRLDQRSEREFAFYSRRRFSPQPVIFNARYRGLGPTRKLADARSGTLEYFLMERSSLFTRNRAGQAVRARLHHVPWPLEDAEAEIERNDLAKSIGIELPESVVLEVVETEPTVKGQTASSSYKPAKASNGMRVMIPPYMSEGERILVSTETGEYMRRAD